jgi:hypothetical protein
MDKQHHKPIPISKINISKVKENINIILLLLSNKLYKKTGSI